MSTSTVTFLRVYTSLGFRPQTERRLVLGLSSFTGVVWLIVIPLEIVFY